jgi:hypothetical protein
MSNELGPGSTFKVRGQTYECLGFQDYDRRDGGRSKLAVLWSECAECGAPFEFLTTQGAIRRGALNRRCPRHKHPGRKVRTIYRANAALQR